MFCLCLCVAETEKLNKNKQKQTMGGGDILKFKKNDEKILAALLASGSVTEAEKLTGVSRTTIYKRLNDAEFKAEYDRRRAMLLDEACSTLQSTLTTAVNTVKEIIENRKNAPQIRLNACGMILQNCLRYVEQIDILSRIEELERTRTMNDEE